MEHRTVPLSEINGLSETTWEVNIQVKAGNQMEPTSKSVLRKDTHTY